MSYACNMELMERINRPNRFRLKVGGFILMGLLSVLSMRLLCVPIVFAYACLCMGPPARRNTFCLLGTLTLFVICTIQPVDIGRRGKLCNSSHSGLRLVPYRHGLIRGVPQDECLLGGCVVSGFEPTWILIWD